MVQNAKSIKVCTMKNISPILSLHLPSFHSSHFPKITIVTGNVYVLLDCLYFADPL